MFQIKNFPSIVASMLNHVRATQTKLTDFNIGSVARTMIEAPAIELDELYQQMFSGLKEAIPVSVFNSFTFAKLTAVPASGLVTVTIQSGVDNVLISAGTAFSFLGAPTAYISLNDVTIAAGNTTANVLVAAGSAGALGNVAAAKAFSLTPTPTRFVSATNAAAFTNGSDEETDSQRLARFADYIATLPRGTIAAVLFGAKQARIVQNGVQVEKVASASLVEPYVLDNTQPTGLVNVYIHNGVGGTSNGLVDKAQTVIDGSYDSSGAPVPGWKAAGIVVVVSKATEVAVAVTAALTAAPGFDHAALAALASAVISNYALSLDIGKSFIRAKVVELVMEIPGVANFIWTAPAADVTATVSQKLMPGAITLS